MRRCVAVVACVLVSAVCAAADLAVTVPPIYDEPYTYAVCPSAALLPDGRVFLAVSVGRWIIGHQGWGEELRLYEYIDDRVNVYVIDSSSWDGEDGLFEVCHNSLMLAGGGVMIASTTTWVPPRSTPLHRVPTITIYDDRIPWVWHRWIGFVTHSWSRQLGGWETHWLGDPVFLGGPDGTFWLYWLERTLDDGPSGTGWNTTLSVIGDVPGNPLADATHIAAPLRDGAFVSKLETAAWNDPSQSSVVGIWSLDPTGDTPPWKWYYTAPGYPGLLWVDSGALVGPVDRWGRNPTVLRGAGGVLVRPTAVLYESTPDGVAPPEYGEGDAVTFTIRIWWASEPPPGLPQSLTDPDVAVGRVWSRRGIRMLSPDGNGLIQ